MRNVWLWRITMRAALGHARLCAKMLVEYYREQGADEAQEHAMQVERNIINAQAAQTEWDKITMGES